MDVLACQVTVYRRETYLAVKFILKNVREEAVTVDYRQTVPDDLTNSHLSFTSSYMGDAWEFEDARLEFTAEIDGGEQIETVYGIKRVDIPKLVDFIRYATIVVTQDGETIETVTGIEPDIEGGGDATEEATGDEADSVEASDRSAGGEPSSESSGGGESTEPVEQTGSDESSQSEDGQPTPETENNGPPGVSESADSTEGPGRQPSNGKTASRSEPDAEGRPSDVPSTERGGSAGERSDPIEWETLTPEEDTNTADESNAATAADSHVPFVTEGTGHEPGTRDDRPPALPANRSDYILEDVRGEIESPGEFEWVDLADDANDTDDGGVLDWVRSRLPL